MNTVNSVDEIPNSILILADNGFVNLCNDPHAYIKHLKQVLFNRLGNDALLNTIKGKYGLSNLDSELNVLPTEDKNKTLFIQSIELLKNQINELLIISLVETDPYLEGVANSLGDLGVTITRYKYIRKGE